MICSATSRSPASDGAMWMGVSVSALLTEPPIGVSPCEASAAERDLFADAVGRQPFMVGVDRDLLLLHAVRAQVRDRLDAAQAVAQVVHVAFQLAVRPRIGFKRDEQRRGGVAEVVVGDHGRDARRLHLERDASPCLTFDHTSSLSFTSSFSSTIT